MSDELRRYYEQELRFIRREAEEFAQQYPAIADRLQLAQFKSLDPHVERMIQAFALLTGRVHSKLDDDFPELTEALLTILYPHYLAPVPSLAIIQFEVDPSRGELASGFPIRREAPLHTTPIAYDKSDKSKRIECQYRTCYPVHLWPIRLANARMQTGAFGDLTGDLKPPPQTKAAVRLQLDCAGEATFSALKTLDRLRFFLAGDTPLVGRLYELLFNNVIEVMYRPLDGSGPPIRVRPGQREVLFPVGFGRDEGLLPYPPHAFVGYRLLTEFFAFPHKFFFLDLGGFKAVREAGFGRSLEVVLFLNLADQTVAKAVTDETFRLGCTPVINLFKTSTALDLKPTRYEYQVVPDPSHRRGMEVYSIDGVMHDDPAGKRMVTYHPFYSLRHGLTGPEAEAFWYAARRPTVVRDETGQEQPLPGTEVYLHLVDLDFDPRLPSAPRLHVDMTCTNRGLARELRQDGGWRWIYEPAAPLARDPVYVTPPTLPRYPPRRRGTYWRLISHLSLNHLSLTAIDPATDGETEGGGGRQALQEVLRLYDHMPEGASSRSATQQLIDSILSVGSRRVVRRLRGSPASGFAQGLEVTIELDRDGCLSTGAYLFASVLERFLGLYTSINSFSQLVARLAPKSEQEKDVILKRWPPRAGEQQLL